MNEHALARSLDLLWQQVRFGEADRKAALRTAVAAVGPHAAADRIAQWIVGRARASNDVSVVATGLSWVGGGTRSVEQSPIPLITAASDEILVTAYRSPVDPAE